MRIAKAKAIAFCVALIGLGIAIAKKPKPSNRGKARKVWTRNWVRRRSSLGCHSMLMNELLIEDRPSFLNFLRMKSDVYEKLLCMVAPRIQKSNTNMRDALSASEKLTYTLRYLATGETFSSLAYSTRIPKTSASTFVPIVCKEIYDCLKNYIHLPTNRKEWEKIAQEFWLKWNFPLCIGALDGKHVEFRPPRDTGSYFYNYKGGKSIVLLALADANYRFMYVDVGANGRISDGGVFRNSSLSKVLDLEENRQGIPHSGILPGTTTPANYCVVADAAFPLRHTIMKPFPMRDLSKNKRLYNYRLSRARRIIENVFGHLANRFRVLLSAILLSSPDKVEIITLTCCALHNFLSHEAQDTYIDGTSYDTEDTDTGRIRPGEWRSVVNGSACGLSDLAAIRARETVDGKANRLVLADYFNNIGKVSWQEQML